GRRGPQRAVAAGQGRRDRPDRAAGAGRGADRAGRRGAGRPGGRHVRRCGRRGGQDRAGRAARLPPGRGGPRGVRRAVRAVPGAVRRRRRSPRVSTSGPVRLDLAATASELAAAAGHGVLQPLGLDQVVDGGGALARLAAAVARRARPGGPVTVLAMAPAVLAGAPGELTRAGVGDLVSMYTCTADWYRAGAVGLDPTYSPAVAGLNRRYGERLLELAAGDLLSPDSLAELARILTLSGIAMGVAGSTAPSSGMEHMISHLLEMAAGARGQASSYHGTQVGVATLVAAAT